MRFQVFTDTDYWSLGAHLEVQTGHGFTTRRGISITILFLCWSLEIGIYR